MSAGLPVQIMANITNELKIPRRLNTSWNEKSIGTLVCRALRSRQSLVVSAGTTAVHQLAAATSKVLFLPSAI